jgi:single-stranded-DNA-specific exonuclease
VLPWKIREVDALAVGRLKDELGLHPVTARCLAGRGIGAAEQARSFLDPRLGSLRRPEGLAGLPAAVDRLAAAVRAGERVGCFGDYDVDGVTTCALMTSFLRQVGLQVVPRVARRDAGYGFGVADAAAFTAAGCRLIVTGDCGTSDLDAIHAARAAGADVIVVDHHTVPAHGAGAPPHPALALVNPFRGDSTFPFRGMASVGLAFYVMAALRTRLGEDGLLRGAGPDMRALLDLVALGTVADLVPLIGENRILTSLGLRQLAARRRPGIAALLRLAGVDGGRGGGGAPAPIDERTIAWKIGPRLNAPGRMGDAEPALALLLSEDDAAAERWAARLEEANQARREAQDRVVAEALAALDGGDPGPAVVVAGRGWQPGVVGIVAAKLVDRYRRPAFVIAVDPDTGVGTGSARSVPGVDLYRALARCQGMLMRFGGHAAAAGLTVAEGRIDELRAGLWESVEEGAAVAHDEPWADAEVELGQVDERLARELSALAPFGQGNAQPLLVCQGLRVLSSRRVGDGSHLKLELADGTGGARPAIAFGQGDSDPGAGATICAAFAPVVSTWQGRRRVELEIRRLAPA